MTICIRLQIVPFNRMQLVERLSAWSYRRQLFDCACTEPFGALRSVIGVYSTHPTAPLALLARCADLTPGAFTALEQRRHAVRLPAMRGSGFLLPRETAHLIFG